MRPAARRARTRPLDAARAPTASAGEQDRAQPAPCSRGVWGKTPCGGPARRGLVKPAGREAGGTMRPPLGATICGRGSRAVGVGEPRRGAPCPVRRGFYLFILVARFLRRPQKRHHGPGNAASGQAKPPLFPSMWCAQVIRHGLGHLSPAWMVCRANERGGVPPGVQADGGSRVGIPAGAARSPARARTRAGMERGAAPALDATGAPPAYRQGGGTRA